MTDVTMPKLADSMEQGTIIAWLRSSGDHVAEGEDLVEIETDKATITYQAEASGVLTILASDGTSVPVGATIAQLGADHTRPVKMRLSEPRVGDSPPPALATDGETQDGTGAPASSRPADGERSTRATPLARRVASAHAIELDTVDGSGPLGRITRNDVLRKAGIVTAPVAWQPVATGAIARTSNPSSTIRASSDRDGGGRGEIEVVELTRLQSVVSERMAEAKATIPHFQVQTDVVMDAALELREELKSAGAEAVPSVNDLIIKAAALALHAHPYANSAYRDGHFERYARVNIGIAVASQDALVVPTIFDADEKSLGSIAAESKRLASRVRERSITPPELSGATFTVSNLGMYGMISITPVINARQAAILGVGALRETLARHDGGIIDRRLMTLTLSCDHRILYGVQAAEFLAAIRERLERPLQLAL